jgi:magnesium transporter
MDAVVDRYFPVVEEIESELERVEQQISPALRRASRRSTASQKLTALQHATRPMLEATGKLFGARVPSVRSRTRVLLRRLRPPAGASTSRSTACARWSTRRRA